MKRNLRTPICWATLAIGLTVGGCSSPTVVAPIEAPAVAPVPPYAYLPHPPGQTIGDVKFLFTAKNAPKIETLASCDADFRVILSQSQSKEEVEKAAREVVKKDPVTYHWCFYSQVIQLDQTLSSSKYIDEKQKSVLKAYEFLTPIAKAYMTEFRDSRYLRWAIQDYRRLSATVFFRKLDIAPETSVDLIDAAHPYTGITPAEMEGNEASSVMEKYKAEREPAAMASPAPSSTPAIDPDEEEAPVNVVK